MNKVNLEEYVRSNDMKFIMKKNSSTTNISNILGVLLNDMGQNLDDSQSYIRAIKHLQEYQIQGCHTLNCIQNKYNPKHHEIDYNDVNSNIQRYH